MGLNRYFSITATTKDLQRITDTNLAKQMFNAIDDRYGGWIGSLDDYNNMEIDGVNWYDVDKDMIEISKQFPNIIFEVYCNSGVEDDIWAAGYCDGRESYEATEINPLDYHYLATGELRQRAILELTPPEVELIKEALSVLAEARESEIKWAGDDIDIVESDQDCLAQIDALQSKIKEL